MKQNPIHVGKTLLSPIEEESPIERHPLFLPPAKPSQVFWILIPEPR